MPACPHCGHDADPSRAECPLCGTSLPDRGRPDAAGPSEDRSGIGGRESDPVPWEDPDLPFPEDLWRTWRESLFSPGEFFRRVTDRGTVVRALLYYLLATVAGAFFALLWQSLWFSLVDLGARLEAGGAAAAGPVISFFTSPFVALLALVVFTLLYHLAALVLAPRHRGMAGTARVLCYAAGPSVLAAVPLLGTVVGGVWSLVLQVVGLREVHRTTTPRALLMVFWIWILFFLFTLGLVVLAAVLGSSAGEIGPLVLGWGPHGLPPVR